MMFAGMVILDSNSTHNADGDFKCGRNSTVREGGCVMATEVDNQEAGVYRRTIRRLGYMRAKVDCAMGLTGRDLRDLHIQSGAQVSCPFTGQIAEDKTFILSSNQDQHEECSEGDGPELAYQNIYSLLQGGDGQTKPSYKQRSPSAVDYSKSIQPGYTFNSSFSFIQQSLNMNIILDAHMNKCPFLVANTEPSLHDSMPVHAYGKDILSVGQLPFSVTVSGQSDKSQKSFLNGEIPGVGQNVPSHSGDRHVYLSVTSDFQDNMPDSDLEYLDTEVTSSFSVNYSDSTSASSVTSGYGSTTSFLDQNWNDMLKKYEEGLQNCLHENGIKSKIELMMLKIQMLQQKSALDDDYKTAVHFGSMLEELKEDVEDDFLKLGLPSQHPNVTFFLERLRMTIHNALQRTNSECRQNKESTDCHMLMSALGTQQSREQLIQEKEQIQKQMMELQHMLGELQKQRLALGEQLNQDDLRLEKEVEERVLRSYSPTQLHLIGRVLEDLITSQHRDQISLSPSQSITSLQEQKQDLGLSNKEAASKVIMSHSQHFWQVGLPMGFGSNMVKSQRLSDSLQSKVCENETQLLDQHEAKLATISGGNDFSSAEEVKAEMKSLYRERECLDSLSKRMLALSTASNQNLVCVKEQQSQLKEEQQKNFAQHEQNLKENTVKYSELLEDILHRSRNTGLEHIWKADLETCQLLPQGCELHALSCSKTEDHLPTPAPRHKALPFAKSKAVCAMLTALGEFCSPEVNLQQSEFTKDLCSEGMDLTEHCKFISKRLLSLEEHLQAAMHNYDQDLTTSLEKEVQEVKTTLQKMLSQLKENNEDEEVEQLDEEHFHDIQDREGVKAEEGCYLSDSWEI